MALAGFAGKPPSGGDHHKTRHTCFRWNHHRSRLGFGNWLRFGFGDWFWDRNCTAAEEDRARIPQPGHNVSVVLVSRHRLGLAWLGLASLALGSTRVIGLGLVRPHAVLAWLHSASLAWLRLYFVFVLVWVLI